MPFSSRTRSAGAENEIVPRFELGTKTSKFLFVKFTIDLDLLIQEKWKHLNRHV